MAKDFILALATMAMITSCQSVDLSEYLDDEKDGYELTFNISKYSITDFDDSQSSDNAKSASNRTRKAASELGSVVNFAVYSGGEKIKSVNQKSGDEDFGTVTVTLPEGDYTIVALVHDCSGNATMTNAEKITFPSNKVTDTFCCCSDLTVTKSESIDIYLDRVVSMFRFTIEDAIPDDVVKIQFYYTGGSSTLNAATGFGCVNSRQTEIREVTDHSAGQVFEVYTFPHEESDVLSMTITAIDANGGEYAVKTLDDIPVEYQKVTTSSMNFFNGGSESQSNSITLYGDDEWKGEIVY